MFVAYFVSPLRRGRNGWFWWVLLFFLDDLYYCFHRGNHEIRLLWAGHVSSQFPITTSEQHFARVGEHSCVLLGTVHSWLPSGHGCSMLSLSLIYQYWLHTEAFYNSPNGLNLYLTPIAS